MRRQTALFFLLLAVVLAGYFFSPKKPAKKALRLLTYSSFAGAHGPGRILKKRFEAFCECEAQWLLAEDSTALFQRFSLIPDIDIIIGWDQITLQSAPGNLWEDLSALKKKIISPKIKNNLSQEALFQSPYFLPLDWAPIGFLRRDKNLNIKSLKSLFKIDGLISFPEPRSSVLGLQLYYWIYEAFDGNKTEISNFLKKLKDKIYGPAFSWSLAYGFFQRGQTDMSLSYLSSLIYHQKEPEGKPYIFSLFEEGHAYQVEYISVSRKSQNKALALEFVKFLLSKEAQAKIQDRHYMFSVNMPAHQLLKQEGLKLISYSRLNDFIKERAEMIKLWEESLY